MREKIASACPIVDYYSKLLQADDFESRANKIIEDVRSLRSCMLDEALVMIASSYQVSTRVKVYCMTLLEKVNV